MRFSFVFSLIFQNWNFFSFSHNFDQFDFFGYFKSQISKKNSVSELLPQVSRLRMLPSQKNKKKLFYHSLWNTLYIKRSPDYLRTLAQETHVTESAAASASHRLASELPHTQTRTSQLDSVVTRPPQLIHVNNR